MRKGFLFVSLFCLLSFFLTLCFYLFKQQIYVWFYGKTQLEKQIVDAPDDPFLNLQAGREKYLQKKYSKSKAFFSNAAKKLADKDRNLRALAYASAGNSGLRIAQAVLDKKKKDFKSKAIELLTEVVTNYGRALDITPQDERILTNKNIAEKLLEGLKKQEPQQKDQSSNNGQNNDQQGQDNQNSEQGKEQDKQESDQQSDQGEQQGQQSEKNQQQGDKKQNDKNAQNQSSQSEQGNSSDQHSRDQHKDEQGKEQQANNSQQENQSEQQQGKQSQNQNNTQEDQSTQGQEGERQPEVAANKDDATAHEKDQKKQHELNQASSPDNKSAASSQDPADKKQGMPGEKAEKDQQAEEQKNFAAQKEKEDAALAEEILLDDEEEGEGKTGADQDLQNKNDDNKQKVLIRLAQQKAESELKKLDEKEASLRKKMTAALTAGAGSAQKGGW